LRISDATSYSLWKLEGLRLMVMINSKNINASFSLQTNLVAILCYCYKHGLLICDVKCGEERCRSAKETLPYEKSNLRVTHFVYHK